MRTLLILTTALAALHYGSAHQAKFGKCKTPTPMENFDPQKFSGTWYVIEKLVTSSDCLMTMFNVTGDTTMTIQELRTPLITQSLPVEVTFTNVGTLDMDAAKKAQMTLRWNGNFLNRVVKTSFTIVDTDYTSYALEVECQSFGFFHRISATIYSRTNSLPAETIANLRQRLKNDYGIDLSRMNKIDHAACLPLDKTDYNIKFDENGLSLLGLLKDEKLINLQNEQEVEEYLGLSSERPSSS